MFGNRSDTSMPDWPYFLNANGLGVSGPGCPWRRMTSQSTFPSSGCPAYLVNAGLGSKVSTWLTPPLMNSEITAVARGLKCGAFGAYGLNPLGFASHAAELTISSASSLSWFSRCASASPLMPPPERKRKSRLDQHVLHVFIVVTWRRRTR